MRRAMMSVKQKWIAKEKFKVFEYNFLLNLILFDLRLDLDGVSNQNGMFHLTTIIRIPGVAIDPEARRAKLRTAS